jgi:Transposase DDE domain
MASTCGTVSRTGRRTRSAPASGAGGDGWTEFDQDDQATPVLGLVAGHGRAAALWLSVWKDELKNQRNAYEDACLRRLAGLVPPGCRVTVLADRGFGDQRLFAFLDTPGFGHVIRLRGNIHVTAAGGQGEPAAEWVGKSGGARQLRDARVAAKGQRVGAVVCVRAKGMREAWCLASSDRPATAATLANHHAKRWTVEPRFRDTKDSQFGMGPSATRIGEPMRRDRLLLTSAFATAPPPRLGPVGETLGMDRLLKSNTSKTRAHSLFRQGCMRHELIPNVPEHRLAPLVQASNAAAARAAAFASAPAMVK